MQGDMLDGRGEVRGWVTEDVHQGRCERRSACSIQEGRAAGVRVDSPGTGQAEG